MEDDDLILIEPMSDEVEIVAETPKATKRPATSPSVSNVPVKKRPRLPDESSSNTVMEVVDVE